MNAVSPGDVRTLMLAIPSWAKILPNIQDDTPFEDSGLDSLALLELVSELQTFSGREIPDDDVEQISTIAGIAQYLNERRE